MSADSANDLLRPVRRVAFTCDFLRFAPDGHGYSSFQPRNLAWLREVLTGASGWSGHAVEIDSVLPPSNARDFEVALGCAAALADYRECADYAWARRYDVPELDVFASIFEQLCEYDLVVGFEMAPSIRRALNACSKPYVNFYVHPLRFLRDLCMGATTNSPKIAACLRSHEVPQIEIDNQVRRFRALFLRQRLGACAIPTGLPVLIGQTERDSVLIRDGRFAGWEDFTDEIAELLSGHDEVVFLEHPYRPNSNSILTTLRSVHGKTTIATNVNSYGILFSNPQIPKVLTLASSLGVEASALRLPTDFLLADPRQKFLMKDIEVDSTPLLGHGVLCPSFWGRVLGRDDARSPDAFCLGENYVRNSLDTWSFRPLQNGLSGLNNRKVLFPSATVADNRCKSLLAALTSFDPLPLLDPRLSTERAAKAGVELAVLDGPLRIGERRVIRLDSGGSTNMAFLGRGFHPPETWGVWSSTLVAELTLEVAPEDVSHGARLNVFLPVSVYEGLLPHCPVLRVLADGVPLGYAMFRPSTSNWQKLEFAVDVKATLCRIGLELSQLESPASKLDPHDARWLGIGLTEFEVECVSLVQASEPRHAPAGGTRLWGIGRQVLHMPSHADSGGGTL